MPDTPAQRSPARITDGISVVLNGEPTVRGPAEDRLADHEAETAAWEARQAEEG